MATIAVTSTPQQIFPDGLQDSMILYNKGPYRVFIDSDSTVNTESMYIPPTGYMAWDFQRPLWVRTLALTDFPTELVNAYTLLRPNATLIMTRNSQPPVFGNGFCFTAYTDNTIVDPPLINTEYTSNLIDVSPYKSVRLNIDADSPTYSYATGAAFDVNKMWVGSVSWYDDNFTYIGNDTFVCPAFANNDESIQFTGTSWLPLGVGANGPRMTFKTRGSYMVFTVRHTATTNLPAFPVTFSVSGSVEAQAESMSWTSNDAPMSYPANVSNTGVILATNDGLMTEWGINGFPTYVFPGFGQEVTISVRQQAASAAPLIFVATSALNTFIRLCPDITVAIAAGSSAAATFRAPRFQPWQLVMAAAPALQPVQLVVTWKQ